jgi:hypothetical protein
MSKRSTCIASVEPKSGTISGPVSTWYRIGFLKTFIVLRGYSINARMPEAAALISVLPMRDLFARVRSMICPFVSSTARP